jgi:23S rRNA (uracil1939-C5)-methyltransferase
MKKDPTPKSFEVTIEKLVYGGSGFARHQGKVVFVPFSVPGDQLLVHPVEEKKTFMQAEIVRILKTGSGRTEPECPHFEKCGGCHWQQLEYTRQVEAKRLILEEIFHHRFPQTREIPILMRACPQPFGYRSRARVQMQGIGSKAVVGFFRGGSHTVEDIESCPLFQPSLNEALHSLRQFKFKVDTDSNPYEMDLACSEEEGTWTTERIGASFNEGVSPLIGTGRQEEVLLRRKIGEFFYSVTASVFFQANDFMVTELATLVSESAKKSGTGSALDLYSGAGLFSLPLARQFQKVVAVETAQPACRLCAANASEARLKNIEVVCADVSSWFKTETAAGSPQFNLIVLDPPRTGVEPGVMEQIRKCAPETIIYVSCDPQTLSRDLAQIPSGDYRIDLVEGLDMFPQTYHFETVVRLIKN